MYREVPSFLCHRVCVEIEDPEPPTAPNDQLIDMECVCLCHPHVHSQPLSGANDSHLRAFCAKTTAVEMNLFTYLSRSHCCLTYPITSPVNLDARA